MTEQEQRIAIAEACGLSTKREQLGGVFIYRNKEGHPVATLPDYLHDLNAMHEAEKTLTDQRLLDYFRNLEVVVDRENNGHIMPFAVGRATSKQRAEAFLRTIGKWKETP